MTDKSNKEYQNNDSELDIIFEEVKSNKLSKVVKRARRYSTIKTIVISLITFVVLSIGVISIGEKMSGMKWNEYIGKIDYRYRIQAPNKFPGMFQSYKGYFGGEVEHITFKYINGMRPAPFMPESMRAAECLREMRRRKSHMVMVIVF